MTKLKIDLRDPQHLKGKFHPALKLVPELPEGSEEFLALAAGVKRAGFIRPILIDQEERVIDDHSRSLLSVAIRWQFTEVPVQVRSSDDAPMLILHSLAHVRHLSKSAIAYLALPQLQPALDAARRRQLENLRKSPENAEAYSVGFEPKTLAELASEMGVSAYMLDMAIAVRKAFEDKKVYSFNVQGGSKDGAVTECTLKEWFEPRLLQAYVGGEHEQNRPMGLGGILAGITAVKEGDKSKFAPKPKQTDFFGDLFSEQICKFTALPEAKRSAALAVMQKSAEEMEPEECEAAADTLQAMAKVYRAAAKQGQAKA